MPTIDFISLVQISINMTVFFSYTTAGIIKEITGDLIMPIQKSVI